MQKPVGNSFQIRLSGAYKHRIRSLARHCFGGYGGQGTRL